MRAPVLPLLLLSTVVLPAGARASATFPPAIQQYFTPPLATPPDCVLCHSDNNGGKGTISTPFGLALRNMYGVRGNDNTAQLVAGLDAMKGDSWDSDGDGVTDVDELEKGDDPNVAPIAPLLPDYPKLTHGCSLGTRAFGSGNAWHGLAAIAAGLLLRRLGERRRRVA